jgi:hypothetical protein
MYIGRRNIEGGGRQAEFHNSSFRALVGLRGDIADGWNYDVSVQFSRVATSQTATNDFVVPNLQNALHAVRDPNTGERSSVSRCSMAAIRTAFPTTRSASAA